MNPKYRWSHYLDEAYYDDPHSYYDDGIDTPKVVNAGTKKWCYRIANTFVLLQIIILHIFPFSTRLTFNDQLSDLKACIDKESRCSKVVARVGKKLCKHHIRRNRCKKSCGLCGKFFHDKDVWG